MRVRAARLLPLLLALAPAAAGAQLEVRRRGPETVAAAPGALTLPFALANRGAAPAEAELRVAAPEAVRPLARRANRTVAAGADELFLVVVRVADDATAGRHLVRVEAEGGGADSVWVEVAPRRSLAAAPRPGSLLVVAGEAYDARFVVRNAGNVPERVTLRASDDRGSALPGPRTLSLAPGEAAEVAYRAATARLGHRNVRSQVTLRVEGEGVPPVIARSVAEVVPRGAGPAPRASLPAELRLRQDASGGAGYDVRGGTRTLSFRARSADPPGAPFARPDEYFVALDARRGALRLGDGRYGLSALRGPPHTLAGGAASLRAGVLETGVYAAGDRRAAEGWEAARRGAFLRAGTGRAGAGLVHDGGASVEGWLRPSPLLALRAEAALPAGEGARHLAAEGASPILRYELRHLRVRPGENPRLNHDAASLWLRPLPWITASAGYRRGWTWAPDGVGTLLPARESGRARLELFRRIHLEARGWNDGHAAASFRSLRAGATLALGPATVAPAAERGERRAREEEAPVPFTAGELRVGGRVGRGALHATLRGEHSAQLRLGGALHGTLPLAAGTELRVVASGSRMDAEFPLAGVAELEVERRFGRAGSAVLGGTHRWGPGAHREPYLRAEYRLPLSLPVPGGAAEGVRVRVLDAATGRPVSGAAVRVAGRTALTDRGGVARLSDVPAGTHPLRVERLDAAAPWIARDGALLAEVGADGRGRLDVEVAAAGTVTGRVVRRVPGQAPLPVPGVRVALRTTGRELHAVTDAAGRFRFDGVWPAWWRATVVAASLPRHHAPAGAGEPVLVRPGGEEPVELEVVERERPVRVVGGGGVEVTP